MQSGRRRKNEWTGLLIVLSLLVLVSQGRAVEAVPEPGCGPQVEVDLKSAWALRGKVGHQTFLTTTPPRIYRQRRTVERAFSHTWQLGALQDWYYGLDMRQAVCAGTTRYHVSATWKSGAPARVDFYRGPITRPTYLGKADLGLSGSAEVDSADYPFQALDYPMVQAFGQEFAGTATAEFTPDAGAAGEQVIEYHVDGWPITTNGQLRLPVSVVTNVAETSRRLVTADGYTPAEQEQTLAAEFTTEMLKELTAVDAVSCVPSEWGQATIHTAGGACTASVNQHRSALRQLSTNELTLSLRLVYYRFRFPSVRDASYRLRWQEKTTYADGRPPSYRDQRVQLEGTGGEVRTVEYVLRPPEENGERTLEAVRLERLDPCEDCSVRGAGPAGAGRLGAEGVDVGLSLGLTAAGESAGELYLAGSGPGSWPALPLRLELAGASGGVEVRRGGDNSITQVRMPAGLAEVTSAAADRLEVAFFAGDQVGELAGNEYAHAGPPHTTWSLEPLDEGAPGQRGLRVVESPGTRAITNEYRWTEATGVLELSKANGLIKERWHREWNANGRERTETRDVHDGLTGVRVSRHAQRVQVFDWGEGLVEEVADPDGLNWRTHYEYHQATNTPYHGRLKQVVQPDGNWVRYDYSPEGRLASITRPFLSTPTNPPPLTPVRKTTYGYDPAVVAGSGDLGTAMPWVPRQVVQENAATWNVIRPGEWQAIQRVAPDNLWSAPGHLTTVYRLWTNGPHTDRLQWVTHPDGTLTVFDWGEAGGDGWTTNSIGFGQPDESGTNVLDGLRVTTIQDAAGRVRERRAQDVKTDTRLATEHYDYDARGRLSRVRHADGTEEGFGYECCGVSHATNRAGSVVQYEYDAARRLVATHQFVSATDAISWLQAYDAGGRLVGVDRRGTNGHLIPLIRFGYDGAGRLVAQTNALGIVTRFTYEVLADRTWRRTLTWAAGTPQEATCVETYALDGSLLRSEGTAVRPERFEHSWDSSYQGDSIVRVALDGTGADTPELAAVVVDRVGRVTCQTPFWSRAAVRADRLMQFNTRGQLVRQIEPNGGTRVLFAYNARGELDQTTLDLPGLGTNELASAQRVRRFATDLATNTPSHETVWRTQVWSWPTNDTDTPRLEELRETTLDGTRSWLTRHGRTTTTQWLRPGAGVETWIETGPDGVATETRFEHGRPTRVQVSHPELGILREVTCGYDAHGRLQRETDARTGTTEYAHDAADRVIAVTAPAAGAGEPRATTRYEYDALGRVARLQYPDGQWVTNEYFATGELKRRRGAGTVPVDCTYDHRGRLAALVSWAKADEPASARTNRWTYHPYLGRPTQEIRPDGSEITSVYYTEAPHRGRLYTRTWSRGPQQLYRYNAPGETVGVENYGSTTAFQGFAYDRLGRLAAVTNGTSVVTYAYGAAGELAQETWTGGPLDGVRLTRRHDELGRPTALTLATTGASWTVTNGFDAASRLGVVGVTSDRATYEYEPLGSGVAGVRFERGSGEWLRVDQEHDPAGRLRRQTIALTPGGTIGAQTWTLNLLGQRTRLESSEGRRRDYTYNALGNLASVSESWADGTWWRAGEFSWDQSGNRWSQVRRGTAPPQETTSSFNALNQLTARAVPPRVEILGLADAQSTVTVNGVRARRHGEHFLAGVTVDNSAGPLWAGVTNQAVLNRETEPDLVATVRGRLLVPPQAQEFRYDADGNLTNDLVWTYRWDGFNQLIGMETVAAWPEDLRRKLDFAYDHLGRRLQKVVWTWNGGGWVAASTNRFVYDGWNLLAELSADQRLVRSFAWGWDASGTAGGAGGAGGLLFVTDHRGAEPVGYAAVHDGRGNVAALLRTSDGAVAAAYDYGPFGELEAVSGTAADPRDLCPLRWSTKYTDDETGLVYYGRRYYHPGLGRWLNPDPSGLADGPNAYAFVGGDPVNRVDGDGRKGVWLVLGGGFGAIAYGAQSYSTGGDLHDIGMAMRQGTVVGAVGGAAAGMTAGVAGTGWGGLALAGAVGDVAGQGAELALGGRCEYNPLQTAMAGALGPAVKALGMGVAPAARALQRGLASIAQAYRRSGLASEAGFTINPAQLLHGGSGGTRALPLRLGKPLNPSVQGIAGSQPPTAAQAAKTGTQLEFDFVPFVERQTLARDFYRAAGWSDSRIASHVKGIDFNYPVEPINIPRGAVLSQHGFPGDPIGNYFANPGTPALGLGIYPRGRVQSFYQATTDLPGLRSTAASVTDTWSVPGWGIDVPGGGTQIFIPNKGGMQLLPFR
jgi:RHS repeat-associated protein